MFVKRVVQRGRSYYYLVESVRSEGKVRHHVVKYLGTADAIYSMVTHTERRVVITRQRKVYMPPPAGEPAGEEDWEAA
jgi:hypothetical protein